MVNAVYANSRVSFSRPGNMMRIPNYAFNHENPYFFSVGISSEIVNLCEQLAGQTAKVNQIPVFLLKFVGKFFGFFEWGQNISDRLAFAEILNVENDFSKSTFDLYNSVFSCSNIIEGPVNCNSKSTKSASVNPCVYK